MVKGADFVKTYLVSLGLFGCLIVLFVSGAFYYNLNELIHDRLLHRSRAFFQEILLTRQWIAGHNGVYVKLGPGTVVNPYLLQVSGLKVVITDEGGQMYTLKNPALVTREISELAEKRGLFRFHITSLKPLNPSNAPDPFEREALQKFANGSTEVASFESNNNEVFFRYMAPLVTEKSCLSCHAQQGYKEGDIRGGISVTSSVAETTGQIEENRLFVIISATLIIVLILGIIYSVTRSFLTKLCSAENKLVDLATHDFLTNLFNRREVYIRMNEEIQRFHRSGKCFSVVLLDIDHFKQVNDIYGHVAGDTVLQAVAEAMRRGARPYDLCCRYGGEEFLAILPETDKMAAAATAERLRADIESLEISAGHGRLVRITVSMGVATLDGNESADQLIGRVDAAMYQAKKQGRNCICFASSAEPGPTTSPA